MLLLQARKGVRLQGASVPIAAAATPVTIFQLSNFAQQLGTKSFRVKRIMISNANGGNNFIQLGTGLGVGFAAVLPDIMTVNNMDNEIGEEQIPETEFFQDLTATAPVLGAGTINIQVEVEELG
jgi:hypothetical protein